LYRGPFAARCAACSGRIQTTIDLLLHYPAIGNRMDDPTIRRMAALPYPYLIFYEALSTPSAIQHAIRPACPERA
jgi:toxin ParE1/3/4